MDVTHGETDANSLQTPQILRSRGLRRPIKLLHYRDTPAIRGGPEPKEAVMNVRFLALAAFFAVPVVPAAADTGQQCYTTNCTGASITSKRKCYACCDDHCDQSSTKLVDCQEECDKVHPTLMIAREDWQEIPVALREGMPATEEGKLAFLKDDAALAWAMEDGVVTCRTIELVDWFIVGGSDQVQRWGLVSLSWLLLEHAYTPEARTAVRCILLHELTHHPDPKIRRLVLGLLAEACMWYDDHETTVAVLRAISDDPSELVRAQGLGMLADPALRR